MNNNYKEMKKVFKNFNENSGWRSIERFIMYVEEYESKKNLVLVNKYLNEFSSLVEGSMISKNFINFRNYCLSK